MAHLLVDARLNGLLRPTARCLVESAKFIVECHPSKREVLHPHITFAFTFAHPYSNPSATPLL